MNGKFDPAPFDKHAAKDNSPPDKPGGEDLDSGLEQSFPASDPASAVQPAKPKLDKSKLAR
jgi:hypothetical protein